MRLLRNEKQSWILLGAIGVVFFVGGMFLPFSVGIIPMVSGFIISIWNSYQPFAPIAIVLVTVAAFVPLILTSRRQTWIAPLCASIVIFFMTIAPLLFLIIGVVKGLSFQFLLFAMSVGGEIIIFFPVISLWISLMAFLAESIVIHRTKWGESGGER